jgi:helicase
VTSPERLDESARRFGLANVDHRVALWIRGYAGTEPRDWIASENALLRILLDLSLISPADLMDADGQSDVSANVLARVLGNCLRDAEYPTHYFGSLSALAFAAAGNFPSAAVSASSAARSRQLGSAEAWMMRVLASKRLKLSDTRPPTGSLISYAQFTETALLSGSDNDFRAAERALELACEASVEELAPSDRYLLLFWQQIHKRFEELSVARLLRRVGFPNTDYADELIESSSPLFYPAQAHALVDQSVTAPGRSVLITLPTSTGKSLLGELALVSSLTWEPQRRWLGVYLAPYRALTDQLRRRMVRRLQNVGIRCIVRRGGYLADRRPLQPGVRTVVVATPEAFDSLLRRSPELYSCIAACVFDEFHLIEQPERGVRYEGLMGRFLSGAAGSDWPKIVALSAVLEDTAPVTRWLAVREQEVARLPWRPSAHRLAITDPDGRIQYFSPAERLPGAGSPEEVVWEGIVDLPHQITQIPPSRQRDVWNYHQRRMAQNVAQVAVDQWRRFSRPILVLAPSRRQTRTIARAVAANLDVVERSAEVSRIRESVLRRHPYLYSLAECLAHGVAYHNAALPDLVRRLLEGAMARGEIRVAVATTTLAEGVDMPFRVVVLADWRQWLFGRREPMPTLLFRNIAGRSGRAWEYVEGDMIIVDTPDEENLDAATRREEYLRLYVNPSPYSLRSSVERARVGGDPDTLAATKAALESQFTAHVAACHTHEHVEEIEFTHSLYAGLETEAAGFVEDAMAEFTEEVTGDRDFAVMVRESPLRLTDFGQAVLTTGLSPRSGIALARLLAAFDGRIEPREGSHVRGRYRIEWEPLLAAVWSRVTDHGDITELEGTLRPRSGARGRPFTEDLLPLVAMAWVSGLPLEVVAFIASRRNAEEKSHREAWLEEHEDTLTQSFEDDIDQVAVLCHHYLGQRWSWVFRGASVVADHMGLSRLRDEFECLATRLEHGVRHLASASLLERPRCPLDRAKVDLVVGDFQAFTFTRPDSLEPDRFLAWILEHEDQLRGRVLIPAFPRTAISATDMSSLVSFLRIEASRT